MSKPIHSDWRVRVLVVEDDEDLQKIMKLNLEHEGFEVIQARNGKEGLQMVRDINPDIVLLDLMMPEMDGFETCKRIKSVDSTRDIPVIVVSAKEAIKDKLKCFSFQADDYLSKPYEYDELAARIYLHINKAAAVQEMRTRERSRAKQSLLEELSEQICKKRQSADAYVEELTGKMPKKYSKSLQLIREHIAAAYLTIEKLREEHDPLYESPDLPQETVEVE